MADFVVVSDFDEFIYSPNLRKELQYMKEKKQTIAKLIGFDMISDTFPEHKSESKKLSFEIIRNGSLNEMMCKPILFSPKYFTEMNFCYGAHFCDPQGTINWYDRNQIYIFHHKFLSMDYMMEKYNTLGKRLSDFNIKEQLGIQYLNDDIKREKEFLFTKNTAIDVVEYINENSHISTPTICISKLTNSLIGMLYSIAYGEYYSKKHNKDLILYAEDKETYELYNTYRPLYFNKYRCVNSLGLVTHRRFTTIKHLEHIHQNVENSVILKIDKKYLMKDNTIFNEMFFSNTQVLDDVKNIYSDINFDGITTVYANKYTKSDKIHDLVNEAKNGKKLLI